MHEFHNLASLSPTQIAEYIMYSHHEYVTKESKQISACLEKIVSAYGEQYPGIEDVYKLFVSLEKELTSHMKNEELVLFPHLRKLEQQFLTGKYKKSDYAPLTSVIYMLNEDRQWIEHLLIKIRRLSNDYNPPVDANTMYRLCLAELEIFEIDLHRHLHLENDVLFPRILNLLNNNERPVECV